MQVSLRDQWIALPLSVNCAKCLLRDLLVVARSIDLLFAQSNRWIAQIDRPRATHIYLGVKVRLAAPKLFQGCSWCLHVQLQREGNQKGPLLSLFPLIIFPTIEPQSTVSSHSHLSSNEKKHEYLGHSK